MNDCLDYCNYCNSKKNSVLFTKNNFKIARCNNCGLMYVVNPPCEKEISGIYSDKYFMGDISRFGYIDYFEEEGYNKLNFKKIITNLEKYVNGGKILDVGCASGSFLSLLGKDWDKHGLDISYYISKYARESHDFKILTGELINLPYAENSFDVVTFLDVLDHMRSPLENLRAASRLLKKGGLLTITCGDTDAFFAKLMGKRWYLYIPPTHLFFFSKNTLIRILNDMGFRIIKIEYSGKWVFLKLCFFRLSYIFPGTFFKSIYSFLKNRNILMKFRLYYNFKDVMTVYAKKE